MNNKRLLSNEEVSWAHRKWCEGHSIESIAEALYCHPRTLRREFRRRGLNRALIPLVYKEESK